MRENGVFYIIAGWLGKNADDADTGTFKGFLSVFIGIPLGMLIILGSGLVGIIYASVVLAHFNMFNYIHYIKLGLIVPYVYIGYYKEINIQEDFNLLVFITRKWNVVRSWQK